MLFSEAEAAAGCPWAQGLEEGCQALSAGTMSLSIAGPPAAFTSVGSAGGCP